jgi:hypothetical protein
VLNGRSRLYNVASGRPITNAAIAELLRDCLDAEYEFAEHAPTVAYPKIDIDRIVSEFGYVPTAFAESFSRLLAKASSQDVVSDDHDNR